MNNHREKILSLVQDILPAEEITLETNLMWLPKWDSLAKMALTADVEDEFGIIIGLGEIGSVETVEQLIQSIEKEIELD